LRRILDDRPLRESLAARGRARAVQFSWEKTGAATASVFRAARAGPAPDSPPARALAALAQRIQETEADARLRLEKMLQAAHEADVRLEKMLQADAESQLRLTKMLQAAHEADVRLAKMLQADEEAEKRLAKMLQANEEADRRGA